MSEECRQTELRERTEQLLRGPLKHARAAALAAALVPLASIATTGQTPSPPQFIPGASGGVQLSVNPTCNGYTLFVAGFGLTQPATVTYSIIVSNTSPPVTVTGSISITPADSLGDFAGMVSGALPQLSTANLFTVTAVITGVPSSSTTVSVQPSCSSPVASVPLPCDFVTSGGFVLTDAGKMANFGAHGGCKNSGFWGHINYVDHTNEYHVNSIQITGYLTPTSASSNIRDICGLATTNNPSDPQPVMFRIRLADFGEPGVADQFGIRLSTGYVVRTRLLNNGMGGGGNVQLHKDNPSTTGPTPLPTEQQMCGPLLAP